jgi:hypothetical protein
MTFFHKRRKENENILWEKICFSLVWCRVVVFPWSSPLLILLYTFIHLKKKKKNENEAKQNTQKNIVIKQFSRGVLEKLGK